MTKFWKYQGTGNDFVVIDIRKSGSADPEFAKRACDRHFGIGADGVLYITKADDADIGMCVINPDGSEAEMCGNGIRCVAKHAYDTGIVKSERFKIRTMRGVLSITVIPENGKAKMIEVNMGAPILDRKKIPMTGEGSSVGFDITAGGMKLKGNGVSMGNPHLVIFSELSEEEKERLGPILESIPLFPKKANVGFASVREGKIFLRVYERGAGWTLACGTGACAATTAAALNGLVPYDRAVDVKLPGGWLRITVAKDLSRVTMAGPAELVFTGNIQRE